MMELMAKSKHLTPPSVTSPVLTPAQGAERLQGLRDRAEKLSAQGPSDTDMERFDLALKEAMVAAFGSASPWTEKLTSLRRWISDFDTTEDDERRYRRQELREKSELLGECIDHLKQSATYTSAPAAPVVPTALEIVDNVLRRFHHVAVQLRKRRENRATLTITDEYDVQDLLHALLHVHFTDIRREETGPSLAGARPRADFLLKNEQIFIEVKKTRTSSSEVAQELLADMALYKRHPDCRTLICFVYDPDHVLMNPGGFIRDLEQHSSPEMAVRVLVSPQ
jgi:hypothetical protein